MAPSGYNCKACGTPAWDRNRCRLRIAAEQHLIAEYGKDWKTKRRELVKKYGSCIASHHPYCHLTCTESQECFQEDVVFEFLDKYDEKIKYYLPGTYVWRRPGFFELNGIGYSINVASNYDWVHPDTMYEAEAVYCRYCYVKKFGKKFNTLKIRDYLPRAVLTSKRDLDELKGKDCITLRKEEDLSAGRPQPLIIDEMGLDTTVYLEFNDKPQDCNHEHDICRSFDFDQEPISETEVVKEEKTNMTKEQKTVKKEDIDRKGKITALTVEFEEFLMLNKVTLPDIYRDKILKILIKGMNS